MQNSTASLKDSLKSLHASLSTADEVDEELLELLRTLDHDIKALLEQPPEDGESTTYGLAERTQEITARFAAQHPRLEPALRELSSILGAMGI